MGTWVRALMIVLFSLAFFLSTHTRSTSTVLKRDVDVIEVAYQNGYMDGMKFLADASPDQLEKIREEIKKGELKNSEMIKTLVVGETKKYIARVVKMSGGIKQEDEAGSTPKKGVK